MVEIITLNDFDTFDRYCNNLGDDSPPVYFYFTGSKTQGGVSWCPDCVQAEPIVKQYLAQLNKNIRFLIVDVGNREYWKNKECPFRTDSRTRLMVIPTIIKWKGVQRLEGGQCGNSDLLQMMFEEDDD